MWNAKYGGLGHAGMMNGNGMMIGMTLAPGAGTGMGGSGWDDGIPATVLSEMPVTSGNAIEHAQKYLDLKNPGATAATNPTQFYGYYTIDFEKDGKVIGMLSVNGYSGQVFLHIWHGTFIEEAE